MKPCLSNNRSAALSLFEVLMAIVVAMILGAILLLVLSRSQHTRNHLSCYSSLRVVGVAFRTWEGDNGDKYPMAVSVTNGGAMELVAGGNAAAVFQVMSNELSTPKILACPEDGRRLISTNFTVDFTSRNVSYFVGIDATETNAQMFLSGDDNLEINDLAVKSGLLNLPTNAPLTWSAARHKSTGNVTFADGSVQQFNQNGLRQAAAQTGIATNRWAIP